jgi:hypothetical protein
MGVCTHEHLTQRCSLLCACYSVMSADGSWSVCTHEHLPDRCSLCSACYSASHVSRWFMEFCTHEHLRSLFSALRFRHASLLSADGSWICTHEHLPDRCSLLCACYTLVMSADGSCGVCTHEHLTDRCSQALHSPVPCQQMVHGVFALMNI